MQVSPQIFAAGLALTPWTTLWDRDGGNLLLSSPYYLIVILIGFGPWTLYLPGAVSACWAGAPGCGRINFPSADDWR
jgi:hypothetical protein